MPTIEYVPGNGYPEFAWLREAMLSEFPEAEVVMKHFGRYHPVMMQERCPVEQMGLMLRMNGKRYAVRFRIERDGDEGCPIKIDFEDEVERGLIVRDCIHISSPMKDGKPPKAIRHIGIP